MKKIKGFLLKHRVTTLFRYFCRRRRSPARYQRLHPAPFLRSNPISKLCSWGRSLKTKARAVCAKTSGHGCYIPMGQDPFLEKPDPLPKGHLAVYVGQEDGECKRVLVPVIYFNHPLFGQLLRDAEEEFGFNHPGGITIPCRISEFEMVKTRIAAGNGRRKMLTWR